MIGVAYAPFAFGGTITHADDDLSEWKGKVTTMPDGNIGDWVIGGVTFKATARTEFEQEHGVFQLSDAQFLILLDTHRITQARQLAINRLR